MATASPPENAGGPWRLWYRPPGKKSKWVLIGAYATSQAAWQAMHAAGDWMVRDNDRHPGSDRKPWHGS